MTPILLASTPFFTFLLVGSITPGPNNLMLAASGMNYGYKRTIPHMLGIVFGFYTLLILSMLGIGALMSAYPVLDTIMKIGASVFLLYLSYKIATAGRVEMSDENARPMTFIQAAAFQYINPKAWVMGLAAIALLPEAATIPEKTIIIAITVISTSACSLNIWTLFGKAMARLFTKEKYRRIVNAVLALLLVATIPMMVL